MTDYYVASNGSDSASGLFGASWLTPQKVSAEVASGLIKRQDRVFFRRGDVFAGGLDLSALVQSGAGTLLVDAYGHGPEPELNGYKIAVPGAWVETAPGVWRLDLTPGSGGFTGNPSTATDVGHIRNGSAPWAPFWAYKRGTLAALSATGDFYSEAPYVYVKSPTNPGAVRIAVRQTGVVLGPSSSVRNLSITGFGAHGAIASGINEFTLRGNRIEAIGGCYISGTTDRYGNGFEGYTNARNGTVLGNLIRQCYDTATTVQGPMSSNAANRILIRGNWIERCNQSFEVWATTSGTPAAKPLDLIAFEENVCVGAGRSWAADARPDAYGKGVHILSYSLPPTIDVKVRRNVFFDARDALAWYHTDYPALARGLAVEDNTVILPTGTKLAWQDAQTVNAPGANGYATRSSLVALPSGRATPADVLAHMAAQSLFSTEAARFYHGPAA